MKRSLDQISHQRFNAYQHILRVLLKPSHGEQVRVPIWYGGIKHQKSAKIRNWGLFMSRLRDTLCQFQFPPDEYEIQKIDVIRAGWKPKDGPTNKWREVSFRGCLSMILGPYEHRNYFTAKVGTKWSNAKGRTCVVEKIVPDPATGNLQVVFRPVSPDGRRMRSYRQDVRAFYGGRKPVLPEV